MYDFYALLAFRDWDRVVATRVRENCFPYRLFQVSYLNIFLDVCFQLKLLSTHNFFDYSRDLTDIIFIDTLLKFLEAHNVERKVGTGEWVIENERTKERRDNQITIKTKKWQALRDLHDSEV